jgi:hypothetical protein
MNECDAPESNKNIAGIELIQSVPKMMLGSSSASSIVT